MTTKITTKKYQLVSKYANYLTWDEKQNAPSKSCISKAPRNLFNLSVLSDTLVTH
jgi:hypothetical protein